MKALIALLLIVSFENARAAEETTLQSVLEELENLKKIISQQQTKIGSLEEKNRKLQVEVVHLKSDQEVIREKMNLKQTKVPNIPMNFGGEPRKLSRGTGDIILSRHKRLISPQEVGFTALRHQVSVVHTNAVIIFETLITNAGSAYNPSSGIFRAPANGLYVFFYNIECSAMGHNDNTQVELVRDGSQTGIQAYCHGTGDVDNSSTLGILHLSAGDTVWVRLLYGDNITFGGKTLFSGFLL
uniref:Complement C1q subcomponent subunit B-like n=1 Tax=Crassostrea virginica TaxID=6565 RepID=A0A8B8BUL6_CRAVI|nr:complement C1q subcomponent subunit B-like [Crassostrea virginica]